MKNYRFVFALILLSGLTFVKVSFATYANDEALHSAKLLCDDVDLNIEITPPFANLSCNFPCVTLAASGSSSNGSYTIAWLNELGQSVITVCEPGEYTAVITDLTSGCTATTTATVGVFNNTPYIDAGPNKEISCLNPCTILQGYIEDVTGDINVCWTGPGLNCSNEVTPEVCLPGIYTLTVHEVNGGCTVIDSVEVMEIYDNLSTNLSGDFCPGECFYYGGNTYCEAGTYDIVYTSSQGCDSIVSISIDEVPLSAEIELPGQITCDVPELLLDATGSSIYPEAQLTWSSIDGNFTSGINTSTTTVDQGGIYIFSINWNNCIVTDTVQVILNQEFPMADAGEDVEVDCIRHYANLAATIDTDSSELFFQWKGPNQFYSTAQAVEVDQVGTYELTVENVNNGCIEIDEVLVKEPEEYTPQFEVIPSCFNDQSGAIRVLNADERPEFKYALNTSDFQSAAAFERLGAGNYLLTWRDELGCGHEAYIEVPELNAIDLRMEDSYSICGDNYIHLNAAVNIITTPGPVTYLWSNGSTDPALSTNRPGLFWVEISSACETVRHEIEVINDLLPIEQNIYVPNAFSPNGDQINDFFRAYVNHDIIAYELHIFDRRGSFLFSTEDPNEGWDGNIKGRKAPSGVYAWKMRITVHTCGGGRDEGYLTGDLTLFR